MLRLGSLVIIAASVMHIAWGLALLFTPLHTTGIDLILQLCQGSNVAAGLVFIAAGLLATVSTWSVFDRVLTHVALFMPQQFLLFVSMIGALQCITGGHFADGVVRPPVFIFVDQIYLIVTCFFHIFAVILGYGLRTVVKFV